MKLFYYSIALLLSMSCAIYAQQGSPCGATRWEGGSSWVGTNGTVDDSPSNNSPIKGIVGCGSAASTQSGIPNNSTYSSSNFAISLSGCTNPIDGSSIALAPPSEGQAISWFQFDIRPFAGSFEFQVVSNDNLGWALYYSDAPTAYTTGGLAGDCSQLTLQACGSDFPTGWNAGSIFETPDFPTPTNYYLVVWKIGGGDFSYTFKARYGCSSPDICVLDADAIPVSVCLGDGNYSLSLTIYGANATYSISDPNSLNLSPSSVTFTNVATLPSTTSALITATYPENTNYAITVTGTGGCTKSAVIAGSAPDCCELVVNCLPEDGGTVECVLEVPYPDVFDITDANVTNYCGNYYVDVSQTDNGGLGCEGSPLIFTNTYTISDDAGNSVVCEQYFTVINTSPPDIIDGPPAELNLACNEPIPPVDVNSIVAITYCGNAPAITKDSTMTIGLCDITIVRTYHIADFCGHVTDYVQTIVSPIPQTPTFTTSLSPLNLGCIASLTEIPTPDPNSVQAVNSCTGEISTAAWLDDELVSQNNCQYTVNRIYRVSNCGMTALQEQTITYTLDNTPPAFAAFPDDINLGCNPTNIPPPSTAGMTATDGCGNGDLSIAFSNEQTQTNGCAITLLRTYTVTDACNRSATRVQQINYSANTTPPTLVAAPAAVLNLACNEAIPPADISSITATAQCGGTLTVTVAPDVTSSDDCETTVTRTYSITDACGQTTNYIQTIISPIPQTPTFTTSLSPLNLGCIASLSEIPAPSPSSVQAVNGCTGEATNVAWLDDELLSQNNCQYSINRIYRASDCGLFALQEQRITYTLDNTPPVFATFPDDINLGCNPTNIPPPSTAGMTATDGCGNGDLSIAFSNEQTQTNGCTITLSRTYTVTDACNRSATRVQHINYKTDTTAPVITSCPASVDLGCYPVTIPPVNTNAIVATDACGPVTVSLINTQTNTVGANVTIIRNYRVTDGCGNFTPCVQTLTYHYCCQADAGTVQVPPYVCHDDNFTVNAIFTMPTTANYDYYYLLVNVLTNTIVEVGNSDATIFTFSTGTPGSYFVYGYMIKNEGTPAGPIPSVGSNIATYQTGGNVGNNCYDLSPRSTQIVVIPQITLYGNGSNISEGNAGGISPFSYNVHVIYLFGNDLPYNFTWDNTGYVRYDITYQTPTATYTGSGNVTASTANAVITIHYDDSAQWSVTVSSSNQCETISRNFANDNPTTGNLGPILDIDNYEIKAQSGGQTDGAIRICVSSDENCTPTYTWSGPETWAVTQPHQSADATSGTGPGTFACGGNSHTTYLSNLPSGWYSVTVSCGSQETEGWYWVPETRRGRAKTDDNGILVPVIENGQVITLKVYPNPALNSTTIQFGCLLEDVASVAVYSIDGKLVHQLFEGETAAKEIYKIVYDMGQLIEGVYLVKVTTKSGATQTAKLLKMSQ